MELRSSPRDKRLVLERLVYDLASESKPPSALFPAAQISFEG
jgi:DNA polymerase-3 subunit delta